MSRDPSYLSVYGITNPWTAWLLARQSELLAEDATSFYRGQIVPPLCPGPHRPFVKPPRMHWRPGAFKCYLHDEPVEISIDAEFEPAPDIDVLSKLDKMLDYVWDPGKLGEHDGKWIVVEVEPTPPTPERPTP